MLSLFLAALPLFLLIGLGWLIRAVRLADDRWVDVLNRYGLYIAFPALIVKNLTDAPVGEGVGSGLVLANLVLLNIALFLFYGVSRLLKCGTALAATFGVCGFYGNIAYLGFPFITSVMPGSDQSVVIHIALYVAVLFTTGIFLLEKLKGGSAPLPSIALAALKNPLILAVVLGLFLKFSSLSLPLPISRALSLAAASASPAVLVAVGVFMARSLKMDRDLLMAGVLTALKLLILPLIFFIFWKAAGLAPGFRVSVLEAAMPVGLTSFALSQIYPMNRSVAAYAVIISTFLSMFTLPALAGLLLK